MTSKRADLKKKSDAEKEKAGGRIDAHAAGNPRANSLKRLMKQPLIDSEVQSQQVLKAGRQTHASGNGSGSTGR
jgi:hypothetical protein